VLDEDTASDDGKFELVPVRGRIDFGTKVVANLRHLPLDEVLGMLGIEHSEPIPGSRFTLTIVSAGADRFPSAQIDGEELLGGERYKVDVLPRALRVVVRHGHV
jgi:hypothetical protein